MRYVIKSPTHEAYLSRDGRWISPWVQSLDDFARDIRSYKRRTVAQRFVARKLRSPVLIVQVTW